MLKRWLSRTFFILSLLLPTMAHAQFNHALTTTGASTLTCTNTTGTSPSLDIFSGTLTGSITPTLPAAAAGCIANDMIWIIAEQSGTNAFTVTTGVGAGTQPEYADGGGRGKPASQHDGLILCRCGWRCSLAEHLQSCWNRQWSMRC